MEGVMFESSGGSTKRKNAMRVCGILLVICGGALMLLGNAAPTYVTGREWITIGGLVVFCIGVYYTLMPDRDSANKAFLRVYYDFVEGRQVSPDKRFRLNMEEIYCVRKTDLFFVEFLTIETDRERYTVLVDDAQSACMVINNRLDELESV